MDAYVQYIYISEAENINFGDPEILSRKIKSTNFELTTTMVEAWTVSRKPGNVIITPAKFCNIAFFQMQFEEQKTFLFTTGKIRENMSVTAICHYYTVDMVGVASLATSDIYVSGA